GALTEKQRIQYRQEETKRLAEARVERLEQQKKAKRKAMEKRKAEMAAKKAAEKAVEEAECSTAGG
ncbi:MAG: electron transporter RnfC, partial [Gammaproteobacteria bacterium]